MNIVTSELKRNAVLLKLMGSPERLAIMTLLQESERSIDELAQILALQPTAVSKHLTRLRTEGLVDYTRYHRVLQYRLTSPCAEALLEVLASFAQEQEKAAEGSS